MSDPQQISPRAASRRSSLATVLMVLFGVTLLLPGICSLFFVGGFALTEPRNLLKFDDPIQGPLWILWLVCFGVAGIGILLLRAVLRR